MIFTKPHSKKQSQKQTFELQIQIQSLEKT
jgi:hypothetical protein